ncbi:MAG: hypothetical protein L0H37_09805 [Nitrosospira sp.]|nr:hypothetical protein [Nitrosospira sp.]
MIDPETLGFFGDDAEISVFDDTATIDNRSDRVGFSGAFDITRDRAGLARAQACVALFTRLAETLEAVPDLPEHIEMNPPVDSDNPFYDN